MWDNHMHTEFSGDSEAKPIDMINAAKAIGLEGLTFTDHLDYDYKDEPGLFDLDLDNYFDKQHKLAAAESSQSFTILTGMEVGLQKSCIEKNKAATATGDYDFIIGSTHVVDGKDPYYDYFWEGHTETELFMRYYATILENISSFTDFDALGHLDYAFRYARTDSIKSDTYLPFRPLVDAILEQLIKMDKALEVNTGAFRKGMTEPNPCLDIISRYHELGGKLITIGADAHEPAHIALGFDKLPDMLLSCGFKEYAVYKKRIPYLYPLNL